MRHIDPSVIAEVREDMEEDFEDFVTCYLDDAERFVRLCGAAIAVADSAQLQFQAHALKSSSAYVGANELAALAAGLEQLGAGGSVDGADDLHRQAVYVFEGVKSELEASVAA
ncbi:MAG: Hpt domain-containing protein [Pseudomonadota bacterium]